MIGKYVEDGNKKARNNRAEMFKKFTYLEKAT